MLERVPEFILDFLSLPSLPTLLVFGVLVPLLIYAQWTGPAKRQAQWERVGLDFGLRAQGLPNKVFGRMRFHPSMYGDLGDLTFSMREETRGFGRHARTWNVVNLRASPPLSAMLHAVREGWGQRLLNAFGPSEASVGDEALDGLLYFKALPEADREVLLDPAVLRALLLLAREHPVVLEHGSVFLELRDTLSETAQRELLSLFQGLAEALSEVRRGIGDTAHRQVRRDGPRRRS